MNEKNETYMKKKRKMNHTLFKLLTCIPRGFTSSFLIKRCQHEKKERALAHGSTTQRVNIKSEKNQDPTDNTCIHLSSLARSECCSPVDRDQISITQHPDQFHASPNWVHLLWWYKQVITVYLYDYLKLIRAPGMMMCGCVETNLVNHSGSMPYH